MGSEELPQEVLRFIADHIDSVPQLEALLLMWDTAPQAWDAETLSRRIYLPTSAAGAILSDLERRKLITTVERGYTFNRESPEVAVVPQLSAAYRRQLARVAGLIHTKASAGVLEFARAFRLKKEP